MGNKKAEALLTTGKNWKIDKIQKIVILKINLQKILNICNFKNKYYYYL